MTQMPAPPQYPTSHYPASFGPTPPPPGQPGHHAPAGPPQRPRRVGFAAGVLAAALVVGGGAGVGGAALYLDAQDAPSTDSASPSSSRPENCRRQCGQVNSYSVPSRGSATE